MAFPAPPERDSPVQTVELWSFGDRLIHAGKAFLSTDGALVRPLQGSMYHLLNPDRSSKAKVFFVIAERKSLGL